MIDSDVSGVAFTAHPVSQDRNQLVIEDGWGLGEAVVSGQITPDQYVLDKRLRKITHKLVSEQRQALVRAKTGTSWIPLPKPKQKKQKLSDHDVFSLARILLSIERHYRQPVDVEWAALNGKFYILQSRPITTLTHPKAEKIKLSKTHTREHTLFYGHVWYESDYRYITELWSHNLKNFILLKEPRSNKLSVWHDLDELDDIYGWVTQQLHTNPAYFRLVKKRFWQYLKPMLPYLEGKKHIQTLSEFKKYYRNWQRWWSPMDSFLLIPDFHTPPLIRKEALQIREKTQEYTESLDFIFKEFFLRTYPHYRQYVNEILPEEVFTLQKRALTPKELRAIHARRNGCALFRGRVTPLKKLDSELKKNHLYLERTQKEDKTLLEGAPAYPGKVQGRARVILYKEHLPELRPGEIVVAEMTNPDFTPYLQKAKAFVTDEGGITCHAAIAARELKKPCVVGTRTATQTLHTGDLIEVDAEKGIVRVLRRKI